MPDSAGPSHPIDRRRYVAALVTALSAHTARGTQQQVFLEMLLSAMAEFNEDLARIVLAAVRGSEHRDFNRPLAKYPWSTGGYEGSPLDSSEDYSVDIFVLAIKRVELHAVLDAFGCRSGETAYSAPVHLDGCGKELHLASHNGLTIGIGCVDEDGLVETAVALGQYRRFVRFQRACLIGMAGGRSKKVKVGDTVIATDIVDYDRRRCVESTPDATTETSAAVDRAEWRMVQTDDDWRQTVRSLKDREETQEWWRELRESMPDWTKPPIDMPGILIEGAESGSLPAEWVGEVHVAPMLSGGALVESPQELERLLSLYNPEAVALDMEGYGFAKWCKANKMTRWLVVRGIADLCGPNANEQSRSKAWQYPSTYVAARLFKDYLIGRVFDYQ